MTDAKLSVQHKLLLILTFMLSGRAMTIAFIGRAGGFGLGDPPTAWLMPLIGDAVIGLSALIIAYFIWKKWTLHTWVAIIVWNAVAIWDALSAWIIHLTVPWPQFFMIEIFGASMFFMASAMHIVCIWLITKTEMRDRFFRLAK